MSRGVKKRHRKDKQPTVVEWEEMNRKVCGALIVCVPIGMRDFVESCNIVRDVIAEMRVRYVPQGDLAALNHRERYRTYAFKHTKSPQDQFEALEHLEKVALDNGVVLSESDKTVMLLARLDEKWKKLILEASLIKPDITNTYINMKDHLIGKWKLEVGLHLHSEHRDTRDKIEAETALNAFNQHNTKRGRGRGFGTRGRGRGREKGRRPERTGRRRRETNT